MKTAWNCLSYVYKKICKVPWPYWLAHWTPDRVARVQALTEDTALCSWARHFTLKVPHFTHAGA